MAMLTVIPPNAENEALMTRLPGFRQTPIPVIAFDGPERHLGPEQTGALLLLHMTMTDDEAKAQAFWQQVALTCQAAAQSPGFIRMLAFFDGQANWALGFWRSVEEAQAYRNHPVHQQAMAEMFASQFEYMHYAGIWQPTHTRTREAYCERCGAQTLMPAERCTGCGNPLADVFAR